MSYGSSASIVINASREKVWNALVVPAQVKQYFFGTDLVTDWKVGSPIFFRGEWQGKAYEDKGTVLSYEPMNTVSYSYWSSMSGIEDRPELYQIVRFDLADAGEGVELTIQQSNVATQESADHSTENWKSVLKGLKDFAEAQA